MSENRTYKLRRVEPPSTEANRLANSVWGIFESGIGHGYEAEDVARTRALMQAADFDAEIYIDTLVDETGNLNTLGEILLACAACCEEAQRAFAKGEERVSWSYVVGAYYYYGEFYRKRDVKQAKSGGVQAALDARHAENRAMRSDAEAWFRLARQHDGSLTKDAAAEAIAGKVVPAKFRTVRGWLSKIAD